MTFLPTSQQNKVPSIRGLLRGGSLVAGIEVSVLISEAHTLSAQPTKLALEAGTQVSDHIILDPYVVAVVFEVSNVGQGAMASKDVFESFKTMLEKRELFELTTEHYTYDNMALISLTPLHAAPYKGRLQCTATLQRINQIKLQTVGREERKLGKPTKKKGSAEVDVGTQKTTPPKRSLLEKIRQKSIQANQ